MFWIAQVILFSFTAIGKQGLLMQLFTTALWIPFKNALHLSADLLGIALITC
jgi:hypothetical protein